MQCSIEEKKNQRERHTSDRSYRKLKSKNGQYEFETEGWEQFQNDSPIAFHSKFCRTQFIILALGGLSKVYLHTRIRLITIRHTLVRMRILVFICELGIDTDLKLI